MRRGQTVEVMNTHGTQVVDTWAFNAADLREFMSMEHSRASMLKLVPGVGDVLVTNRRAPILSVVADTSGGVHDTLIAACDRYRYAQLGCVGHHDNCADNLGAAMQTMGCETAAVPAPLNLFMNIPVSAAGRISFEPPIAAAESSITLRAEMDLIVVFSACPQDMIPVNGRDCRPTEAHFRICEGLSPESNA